MTTVVEYIFMVYKVMYSGVSNKRTVWIKRQMHRAGIFSKINKRTRLEKIIAQGTNTTILYSQRATISTLLLYNSCLFNQICTHMLHMLEKICAQAWIFREKKINTQSNKVAQGNFFLKYNKRTVCVY